MSYYKVACHNSQLTEYLESPREATLFPHGAWRARSPLFPSHPIEHTACETTPAPANNLPDHCTHPVTAVVARQLLAGTSSKRHSQVALASPSKAHTHTPQPMRCQYRRCHLDRLPLPPRPPPKQLPSTQLDQRAHLPANHPWWEAGVWEGGAHAANPEAGPPLPQRAPQHSIVAAQGLKSAADVGLQRQVHCHVNTAYRAPQEHSHQLWARPSCSALRAAAIMPQHPALHLCCPDH